jgi:TRAP transporter TAXI family solute receptor
VIKPHQAPVRRVSQAQPVRRGSRRGFLLGAGAIALGGGGALGYLARGAGPLPPAHLVLATGPKGAVFVEVGGDIARALEAYSRGSSVQVVETAATVDNLHRLGTRQCDLGFASLDGATVDQQVRRGEITALTRVYDSYLHLVALAGSAVQTVRDLEGRQVSVGGAGSGTEFTAVRLLEAAGVRPARLVRLGQTASMAALADGSIDAAFSLTGYPTPAITDLAARRPLRLVPAGEYFGFLDRAIPHAYQPAPIPAGAYAGVPTSTDTVLVPNVLLGRPQLPGAAVTLVLDALFSARSERFWRHPESRQLSRAMAGATGGVTLHPAAQEWLDAHQG